MRHFFRSLRLPAFTIAALALAVPSVAQNSGQSAPALLIVSQPAADIPKSEPFVDFSFHIDRELKESGKYTSIIFKTNLPALHTTEAGKALTPMDLVEPTSKESARKIARFLGANFILHVTGRFTKNGVAGYAEMEKLVGQNSWGVVFAEQLDAYRGKGKQPSPLEGILVHVANLMQKLTNAPSRVAIGDPVEIKLPDNKPKEKRGAPKTDQAKVGQPKNDAGKADPSKADPQRADPSKAVGPPELVKTPERATVPENPPEARPIDPKPIPAAQVAPPSVSATELLADRFRRQGDLANLIIALRKGVSERPKDVRLRQDLVRAYLERGWQSVARDEALRAVSLAPNEPGLHRLVGDCYLASGDGEPAVSAYREAIKLDSKDAANYVALGDALLSITRTDEAQAAYSNAAAADLKNPVPHRRLARVLAQSGKYADCVREMGLAKDLTPAEDNSYQLNDYSEILGIAETNLRVALARLADIRKSLLNGSRNREQTHSDCMAQKKKTEEMTLFLESLQTPPQLGRITALYAQAASLAFQLCETSLQWIETQETKTDEEASLLRVETSKQLDDATKKLKALTATKGE
jgi:tetratricopeptide (TPR) repeat protein